MKDDEKTIDDQSFYNEALTGSGTINEDGTYGPPLPDPTTKRGLGGFKTSGGRDVASQGLGEESALSNRGEPESDKSADDADDSTTPKKTAPRKATGAGEK